MTNDMLLTVDIPASSHALPYEQGLSGMPWKKYAAVTASIVFHALIVMLLVNQQSQKVPQIDLAGKAGNAVFVVAMSQPQLSALETETTESVSSEPEMRTVVVAKADIVINSRNKSPAQPVKKKSVASHNVAKHTAKVTDTTLSPKAMNEASHTSVPVNVPGTPSTQTSSISSGRGGSAAEAGETTAGHAAKGAGITTSTAFHILNRRVNYPTRARSMGVEGRVKVEYDVSTSGTIKNIRILAENPPGVFSSELRKDMLRWRYNTTGEIKNQIVTVVFKIDGHIHLIN